MTDETNIEWTDFTVNFYEGCQAVGPGCDHCYAEARDQRFTGGTHWGPGAPRRKVKGGVAKLRKINREAKAFREQRGYWPRVFCSSLSDVFDNAVDPAWRDEAFAEMAAATNTRIQMLTKRIGNVAKMIPEAWTGGNWPAHIGLMITVVTQEEADRDVPKLLNLKQRLGIPWVGLSMEPLLGPVNLKSIDCGMLWDVYYIDALDGFSCGEDDEMSKCAKIDWVICGGESGPNARPMHPAWARSLRDQCQASGVAFFFKQWGEWHPGDGLGEGVDGARFGCFNDAGDWVGKCSQEFANSGREIMFRVGKKAAGRLLDGREWNEVPE